MKVSKRSNKVHSNIGDEDAEDCAEDQYDDQDDSVEADTKKVWLLVSSLVGHPGERKIFYGKNKDGLGDGHN